MSTTIRGGVVFLFICSSLVHQTNACTIGVADGSVTADDRPLLWKSRMWSGSPNNQVVYFDGGLYDYLGIRSIGQTSALMGLNEAGLAVGNSLVGSAEGENGPFMNYILGNFSTVEQVEAYIQDRHDANTLSVSGCFQFMDASGEAATFEIDHSTLLIKYDTKDPDRAAQGTLGWVVRANEFHERTDGTDDLSIAGRYRSGAFNTYGLVQEDRLSAETVMQGDSGSAGYEFMRYGPGRMLTTIAQSSVCSSMVVQGVRPEEDPLLSTMWVLLGQANYGISVPTWVGVSALPECLSNGNMAARANSLYAKGQEAQTQASVFSLEKHIFDETNELLNHWRAYGLPSDDEMERVEWITAEDAYRLLNCLDTIRPDNQAPMVVMADVGGTGLTLDFSAMATDSDGSVVDYEWDFGDGQTSNGPTVNHTYQAPGWYLVSCTVTDNEGVSSTDWEYCHVLAALRLTVINDLWGAVGVEPNLPGYEDANTVVTLTALPIQGRYFSHWEIHDPNHPGDANFATIDANNPLEVVMSEDREIVAVFRCGSGAGQLFPLLPAMFTLGGLLRGGRRGQGTMFRRGG